MLLWLSEPSTLTIISLIGLFLTIGDYILPTIVYSLYKNEDWDRERQQKYEEICTNLIIFRTKLELLLTSYYRMRLTNPKLVRTVNNMIYLFLSLIIRNNLNLILKMKILYHIIYKIIIFSSIYT